MKIPVEEELIVTLQATLEAVRIELANVRKMAQGNDPFSLDEAASYLKVANSTLHYYMNNGLITPSVCGKRVWITRAELDLFIASHRRKNIR